MNWTNPWSDTLPKRARTATELRHFAVVMATVTGGIGCLLVRRGSPYIGPILVTIAVLFVVFGVFLPNQLRPVEQGWMKFGEWISRVTTVIIVGAIFFLVVTPLGLCRRALGHDPLELKRDRSLKTYWRNVEEDGSSNRPFAPY